MPSDSVQCTVYGQLQYVQPQHIAFNSGTDLTIKLNGVLGPRGICPVGADLIDLAVTIYQIEHLLTGKHRTNPPENFELSMKLRCPDAWDKNTIETVQAILLLLGNAKWNLEFKTGLTAPIFEHKTEQKPSIRSVILHSGGMDSTCGLAVESKASQEMALVSFYTRQKTIQKAIAKELGYGTHVQWRKVWNLRAGKGHSFYYRSFLFLCLAAVTANSWETTSIMQFENGILASAIPPSPSWMMTKHAHPEMYQLASKLFSQLFAGHWEISNPFMNLTKRECANWGSNLIGIEKMHNLIRKTETCWFHYSNKLVGGKKKKPGTPCGVCIPCILRKTGFGDEIYAFDLRDDAVRNDSQLGVAFRSYFGFLKQVIEAQSSFEFYALLPASGRSLIVDGHSDLATTYDLFKRFAFEFMETFNL